MTQPSGDPRPQQPRRPVRYDNLVARKLFVLGAMGAVFGVLFIAVGGVAIGVPVLLAGLALATFSIVWARRYTAQNHGR